MRIVSYIVPVAVLATASLSPAMYVVRRNCQNPGQLAITFDDGPSVWNTRNLLKTLEQNGIKATFFVNSGNTVNLDDPKSGAQDVLRETYEQGHVIGSHTYSHRDLRDLNEEDVRNELCWVDRSIANVIGKAPRLFRAPYGKLNSNVTQMLEQYGYTTVHWNIDTKDYIEDNTIENMVNTYTDGLTALESAIALQHDIFHRTVNQLTPAVLSAIKTLNTEKQWTFVTADTCVGVDAYREYPWQSNDPKGEWYCPPIPDNFSLPATAAGPMQSADKVKQL